VVGAGGRGFVQARVGQQAARGRTLSHKKKLDRSHPAVGGLCFGDWLGGDLVLFVVCLDQSINNNQPIVCQAAIPNIGGPAAGMFRAQPGSEFIQT